MLFFSLIVTRTNAFRTNTSVYRDEQMHFVQTHQCIVLRYTDEFVTIKLKIACEVFIDFIYIPRIYIYTELCQTRTSVVSKRSDLSPCDFFLFPLLKKHSGLRYESRSALGSAINQCLHGIPKKAYFSAFTE